MDKGRLYFLVGIARSGKSTISNDWVNRKIDIKNNQIIFPTIPSPPRIVVCSDQIRLALHGQPFAQEAESMVHTIKMLNVRTYINAGYDVLVDGTHTNLGSIKELLYIDSSAQYLLIDTPINICMQRAKDSGQEYLISRGVIERMNKNLCVWKHNHKEIIDGLREEINNV